MDFEVVKTTINAYIAKLNATIVNFGKSPNRNYTRKFLINKKEESTQLYKKANNLLKLNEEKFTPSELDYYLLTIKQKYSDLQLTINQKILDAPKVTFRSCALAVKFCIKLRKAIMATSIAEIIKITSQLIPQYDGSVDKLPSVLAALAALNTLVTDANRVAAIQVVLSRLDGKARVAVGDNPATIDDIKNRLKEKCETKLHPETVVAKLNATKQTGSIGQFAHQIETLTLDLEKCYLSENIPVDAAANLATRAGVKALTAGIRNTESKMILKAGQFNSLASAIAKAIENEPVTENGQGTSQVLYAKRGSFQSRGRGNNHYSRGRGNFNGRPNYRRNFQNNYNHGQQNTSYNRGNGRGRGRGMNHTSYYAHTQSPPQQINASYQQIPPQQINPAQQYVQEPQILPNHGNIHPLGVTLRQHIQ